MPTNKPNSPKWEPLGSNKVACKSLWAGLVQYFQQHNEGRFSLVRSFWLNYLGIVSLAVLLTSITLIYLIPQDSARALFIAHVGAIVILALLFAWASVGVWISSRRYSGAANSKSWTFLARLLASSARVSVISGGFFFVFFAGQATLTSVELAEIALDIDRIEAVEVIELQGNQDILILGEIGTGSYEALLEVVSRPPGVAIVRLDSRGGRVAEAIKMGELLRRHNVTTYVHGDCLSACTALFLAGNRRVVHGGSKLGFHSARSNITGQTHVSEPLHQFYRQSGVPEAFLQEYTGAHAGVIQVPSIETLWTEAIITDIQGPWSTRYWHIDDLNSLTNLIDAEITLHPTISLFSKIHQLAFAQMVQNVFSEKQGTRIMSHVIFGELHAQIDAFVLEQMDTLPPDLKSKFNSWITWRAQGLNSYGNQFCNKALSEKIPHEGFLAQEMNQVLFGLLAQTAAHGTPQKEPVAQWSPGMIDQLCPNT